MSATYDYYRIFYFVAKYRSFTQAARVLMNSQPNITRAMNNLERELGCRLFRRSNRGVTLTPEGERLFAYVEIAQEHLQAGEAELTSAKNLLSGSISIGTSEIALHGLLLPVLREFHAAYPDIHIRVTNHSTPQAIAAVKSGAVELAVVTAPAGTARPLREEPLMTFRDILIGGSAFGALTGEELELADLLRHPIVSLERNTKTYAFYAQMFAMQGLSLRPDIEVATADQILPMVKYDLGLGFLPEFFAREAMEKGEVFEIPLKERLPERQICLVRDSRRPLSAAAQRFCGMLRAYRGAAEPCKAAAPLLE